MKQFILALFIALALAVPAFSTEISIAAHQVGGFQPPNIGQALTLTVSATNGSATVTSAALFRTQWVGLGGFRINLSGTYYYVQSVDSTSSLTLTTNFAGSTGSATMIFYPYVEARLYSSISFYPNGSNNPVLPGAPNGGPAFRRYAASIINVAGTDTLYLPAMTIPATTDGTPSNQARISMFFHRPDGALVGGAAQIYTCNNVSQFRIPTTTPTSWKDICTYNAAPQIVLPETYVTTSTLNSLLPSCTANQMIYFAATGRAQACATVGSGLQLSGGVLSTTGGTNVTGIREAVNVKRDHSCAGDGVTNDTACIVAAITAAQASGKELYFPAGTYLTDTITQSLSNLVVIGDGYKTSLIKARNANTPIVNLTGANYAVDLVIQDLGFVGQGATSGSSGHCVVINDVDVSGSGLAQATLRNVHISQCGGKGLYVPRMFNVLLDSVIVDHVGGNGFELHGSNTTTLLRTYVKTLDGANTAAYRIYAGTPTLIGANGIDSCPNGGCDWGVMGRTVADDGVDSYVRLNCTNCNIEDFKNRGIYFKYYSSGNFFNTNFFAPTTGTVRALKYDYVDETIQGIFDGQSSIVTQGASWTNGYPIHSNAAPFHSFSVTSAPYNTFWNGTDPQIMSQWGYSFESGIGQYFSRSTGLSADKLKVGAGGIPSGYQSYFRSTATTNIGLAVTQAVSQTARPFIVENATSSVIFGVNTDGSVASNAAGALAFTVKDTSGNALLRAARANTWADSVASSFVQLGGSAESGWISGLNAGTLPRLGITATATQITDTDTGSAPAPGSNLLGLYKTTSGNLMLELRTSTVQTGDIISYHNSSAVKFKVDASGYATTERLRLSNVAGDPSSPANGDIAYNSTAGKFRCYEAGAWADCIGSGGGGGAGTVTSVGVTAGTSGADVNISGSPITSSGTITVNVPDASATARGVVTTGSQTIAGAKTLSSTLSATQINPSTDNMYSLGTSALRWAEVNVGPGSLYIRNDNTNTSYMKLMFSSTNAQIITDSATPLRLLPGGGTNGVSISTAGVLTAVGTGGISGSSITTGAVGVTMGGTGLTSWATNGVPVATGTNTVAVSVIPSCSNATTSKLLYNSSTQAFTCGTDQTGGGGSGITDLNLLTGSVQTFGNDTNVTIVSTGTTHQLTWAGTLAVARGGSGAGTLTGILLGNGTSAFTGLTTSAGIFGAISDESGSGALLGGTAPTITGGTHTAITGLGIRSTGSGAFDLQIINTENLTGNKALTVKLNDAAKTVDLGGNLVLASSLTTTNGSVAFNGAGGSSVTLPVSGTLSTLAGTESLTNKKLGSLTSNGLVTTSAGDGTLSVTVPATGVLTFLATPSSANLIAALTDETGTGAAVFANTPTLVTPILGTPTSATLTNATGLPISTGVSGLGTGVATFLGTPSSANLATALTDETGTGVAVFGTSPAITTSLTTPSTTFALLNTTATTVNAFGAATTVNIGAAATTILNFGGSTTAAEFRFLEPSASGTNYTAFKAVAQGANITYSLPATVGAAGTVLRDAAGNGVLDWGAAITGAVASTEIAFGGASSITSSPDFTYTTATGRMDISKDLNSSVPLVVTNTNAGGAAQARISAVSDASGPAIAIAAYSSGYTPTAGIVAGAAVLDMDGAAAIIKGQSGGTMRFLLGATEYMRLTSTSLNLPTVAGAAPTASGNLVYDSTSNTLEFGENGTNRVIASLGASQTFTGANTFSTSTNVFSSRAEFTNFYLDAPGSFNMRIVPGTTYASADKTLTITTGDANRALNIQGDVALGGALTSSAAVTLGTHALTFTTTGSTNVTVPTAGTLVAGAGAFKSSDTSRTSTTTLADDANLSVTLEASKTYSCKATLFVNNAGTSAGFKVAFGGTATATSVKGQVNFLDNTSGAFSGTGQLTAIGSTFVGRNLTNGGNDFIQVLADVIVNAGGTLTIQWAQNNSSGSATTLQSNSDLVCTKLN